MPDHLTPLDATFLELEQADDCAHMHIGAVMVFDPVPGGGAPPLGRVRRHLAERLDALPRYRQRLSEARPGGLAWPAWVPAERFDIADHVGHAALPAPGTDQDLLDWAAGYWSHRLDRHRPLWDAVLVEGLRGGRWALATKTHHCMVDGIGSLDVGHLMLDPSPDSPSPPPAPPPANGHPEPGPGPLRRLPAAVARGALAGIEAAVHPARVAELLERSRAVASLLVHDELIAAPRTSLNVPLGALRRYDVVRAELDDLRAIRGSLGGTVNDVVLAAVAGGLRRVLLERGEDPPAAGMRAMIPVNVRAAGEHLRLGNRITSLFVHLPVAEPDPLARYRLTVAEAERRKAGSQAVGGATLVALAGLAPPALHAALARSLFASRLFNVTVTNVPGPPVPLYALGARMREVLPLVPLAAEHAVGVAVLSYDGGVTFGLVADRDAMPDLDLVGEGVEMALEELRGLSGRARTTVGSTEGRP